MSSATACEVRWLDATGHPHVVLCDSWTAALGTVLALLRSPDVDHDSVGSSRCEGDPSVWWVV